MSVWDELNTFIGHYNKAQGKDPDTITVTKAQHDRMLALAGRRTDVVVDKKRVVSYRGIKVNIK